MATYSIPSVPTSPVIIGYGNPLRQDDGLGWRVAELVREAMPYDAITILEEHQLVPEMVAQLEHAPLVIFLDAAVDLPPGCMRLQGLRPAEPQPWSHHILPAQLLTLAQQVNGTAPPAFLISGGIGQTGFSETLTSIAENCAQRMADLALRLALHKL
jgi:hydrogenase maturation protease